MTTSFFTGDVYSGDCPSGDCRLTAGDVIADKYEIVSFLGAGGMGSVWRAHCRALDVDVAVKILHHDVHGTGERLHREARVTAQIGHPAIVRALDFGTMSTGELFLVMEYLDGCSLCDWIRERGPMPAAKAVPFLLPIADGLAAAHARGIVHRDVKPENIIVVLDRSGAYLPKIVDFGIAKTDAADDAALTQEGALIGSPLYMAPEQAMGERVTPQADVWALSVVLYELVTGRSPFQAATTAGVLVAVQTKPPAPAPELARDAELWAIVQRGLRKSREGRFPTMRAFGQALAAWALARGIVTDATGASIEHVWMDRVSGEPLLELAPWSEDSPSDPLASPPSMSMSRTLPSNRTTQVAPVAQHDDPSAPEARVTSTWPSSGSRRALRNRALGLLAALACVPVLGAGGFCAHTLAAASTHVGSPPALAAALVAGPPAEAVSTAPPSPAAPPDAVVAPAPAATVPEARRAPTEATAGSRAARGVHRAPARLPKAPARALPLPASPDF